MAYRALYSDGYTRIIGGKVQTYSAAVDYALALQKWFNDGGFPDRKLNLVEAYTFNFSER